MCLQIPFPTTNVALRHELVLNFPVSRARLPTLACARFGLDFRIDERAKVAPISDAMLPVQSQIFKVRVGRKRAQPWSALLGITTETA